MQAAHRLRSDEEEDGSGGGPFAARRAQRLPRAVRLEVEAAFRVGLEPQRGGHLLGGWSHGASIPDRETLPLVGCCRRRESLIQLTSYTFLFAFLPVTLLVYWLLPRGVWRLAFLTLASWVFVGWYDWRFVLIMVGATTIDWIAALLIAARPRPGRAARRHAPAALRSSSSPSSPTSRSSATSSTAASSSTHSTASARWPASTWTCRR